MPLVSPAYLVCHLDADHIGFLPTPVLQFHVVDPHSRIFRPVLDNNTFFHAETAENRLPTVPGASIHEKGFLYTTPWTFRSEVQSGSDVADEIDRSRHNNHRHPHVSIPGEQSPHQSYDVDNTCSETKR